jgi:hypothetical protein
MDRVGWQLTTNAFLAVAEKRFQERFWTGLDHKLACPKMGMARTIDDVDIR